MCIFYYLITKICSLCQIIRPLDNYLITKICSLCQIIRPLDKGLTGTVAWGWTDAYIKVDGKSYSMEQIGNMLLRVGTESIVIIKVMYGNNNY
ncbi:MAG: DUF7713 domain-containing protein [Candidatus Humimicrobiaceae bacterium]